MEKQSGLLLVFCLLIGCDGSVLQPKVESLTAGRIEDARTSAASQIGERGRVYYICGQSSGLGLSSSKWAQGFQSDGVKDGRLVFISRSDAKVDVVFRDASGNYVSALDDGGDVRRIQIANTNAESWVLVYPSTGVAETHNITRLGDGQLVDLWTSNKPHSISGASAKLFIASCVRA
jgi:hypothetical protein